MSSFDRLVNLARGTLAETRNQWEADGGLDGATQRVRESVREMASGARSSEEAPALRTPSVSTPESAASSVADPLARVDAEYRAGRLSAERWQRERAQILETLEQSAEARRAPRPRTL